MVERPGLGSRGQAGLVVIHDRAGGATGPGDVGGVPAVPEGLPEGRLARVRAAPLMACAGPALGGPDPTRPAALPIVCPWQGRPASEYAVGIHRNHPLSRHLGSPIWEAAPPPSVGTQFLASSSIHSERSACRCLAHFPRPWNSGW